MEKLGNHEFCIKEYDIEKYEKEYYMKLEDVERVINNLYYIIVE